MFCILKINEAFLRNHTAVWLACAPTEKQTSGLTAEEKLEDDLKWAFLRFDIQPLQNRACAKLLHIQGFCSGDCFCKAVFGHLSALMAWAKCLRGAHKRKTEYFLLKLHPAQDPRGTHMRPTWDPHGTMNLKANNKRIPFTRLTTVSNYKKRKQAYYRTTTCQGTHLRRKLRRKPLDPLDMRSLSPL